MTLFSANPFKIFTQFVAESFSKLCLSPGTFHSKFIQKFRSLSPLTNPKGFSLVEIMIVFGIIGTILALIGNRIVGANDKAKVRQAKIVLTQVSDALNNYYTDCGKYPSSLNGLLKEDADCSNWGPGAYMKPTKDGKILDPWNNEIQYSPTNSGDFSLTSLGKDGQPGGTGYAKDISLDEESAE